ncbi:xanthine dehydrogenase family protein subunit M [Rhizobiales bacterium RZME27]|uniref:Xanthine dehydrogenase family protein subunit M n=1 Tax=Endobacterium cereale TaxID=2663029 RepID=A0A6A8A8Q2_9HYPH|nr:xanthine dehydrogenase family protein subunit M [Endobacterium cereale]MQY45171.1 xanthine dehydrogenase family protein subunit M [Endobacterium cereale]
MRTIGYERPETLDAAIAAYSGSGSGSRYIAGGTTLYDLMKLGVETPTHLIDITAIANLDRIETEGDVTRFGTMALMSDVAETPAIRTEYPVLSESLLKAASQQLRNMATVGGNLLQRTRCPYFRAGNGVYPCNKRQPGSGCAALGGLDRSQAVLGASGSCNAVSPGDWPVALLALDARVEIIGIDGQRTLPLDGLYRLPAERPEADHNLNPGDIIIGITVPKTAAGRASTYHKIRDRESFAFALASAAVAMEIEGAVVRDVRIALGGVATLPWRARQAESVIVGRTLTRELAVEAGRAAFQDARPGRHNRFKIDLGVQVVADALMIAAGRNVR